MLKLFSKKEEEEEPVIITCDKPSSKFYYKDCRNISSYVVDLEKVPSELIPGIVTDVPLTPDHRNEETIKNLNLIPKSFACLNIQPINKDSLHAFLLDCLPETRIQWSRREVTDKLSLYCKSNENLLIISRVYAYLGTFISDDDNLLKIFIVKLWKGLILALVREKHISLK